MKKDTELRVLAKNLYWYDYLDAKEMDVIFKGGKLANKEKVREYKFTTDIEEQKLATAEIDPALPAENPSATRTNVQGNKADDKENKKEKEPPKKPGPDDNSGSDGGPGGERLIPESILPGRNGDSANPQ